jgi:hypothetical protein
MHEFEMRETENTREAVRLATEFLWQASEAAEESEPLKEHWEDAFQLVTHIVALAEPEARESERRLLATKKSGRVDSIVKEKES